MQHSPIKIATFNVRNLSLNCKEKKLEKIANIINDNDLDIVAMQEVLSRGKMIKWDFKGGNLEGQGQAYERSLLGYLGKLGCHSWDAKWGDPKPKAKDYPYLGDSRGEGYAFLWRTDRFELPKDANGKDIEPDIIHDYHIKIKDGQIRLIRDPFYGRFIYKLDPKFEIRLLDAHIVYGKPKEENMKVELDYGATKMRKNEFNILAGEIYKRVNDAHKDIHPTSAYTILLGDYNMNLEGSNAGYPYIPKVVCFDPKGRLMNQGAEGYKISTIQDSLSTLKQDGSDYSHNYDHFSYNEKMEEIIANNRKPASLANVESQFKDLEEYKTVVSDHVPVVIEISI